LSAVPMHRSPKTVLQSPPASPPNSTARPVSERRCPGKSATCSPTSSRSCCRSSSVSASKSCRCLKGPSRRSDCASAAPSSAGFLTRARPWRPSTRPVQPGRLSSKRSSRHTGRVTISLGPSPWRCCSGRSRSVLLKFVKHHLCSEWCPADLMRSARRRCRPR